MALKPDFIALQQAATWYAELQESPSSQSYPDAFQHWLDAKPENRLAWQSVLNISQRFQPLCESEARKTAALTALTHTSHHAGRRQVLKMAAWLSVGSLLGWSTWRHTPLHQHLQAWNADYYSPRGTITPLTLADGSRIWLDTDSALDVDYSPTQRALRLLNGRVMIETAADPQRELTVTTTEGTMRALGTRFSVQARDGSTELQVYQGAVEVSPAIIGDRWRVNAGHAVTFNRNAIAPVVALNSPEPAWPRGLLQVENLPLGEFITRLSAYRSGYLGCDPAVAALTVTGTFPLHDTDLALAMLTDILPVHVHRRFPWWLTVSLRGHE